MRVLVTGGAGYIGSHACAALADAGHEPVVFDNLRTGHRWAVQWGPFEHGDIADGSRLQDVLARYRPDAVMHFAALAYVGESVTSPGDYYRTNVAGTLNLLHAMRTTGTQRLVFSSTCAIYGISSSPITETKALAPINPYGRSKHMAEAIIHDHATAYGLAATCLRYFNAAGADPLGRIGEEHDPEPHLIPVVLQTALGLRPHVEIFGADYDTPDGTCIRDYIHVSDLAAAHVAALSKTAPGAFEAFNLGTGAGASVCEVIAVAERVTGRQIPVRHSPRRTGDPPVLVASPVKAMRDLDWSATRSDLESILLSAWRWMSEHRAKAGLPGLSPAPR